MIARADLLEAIEKTQGEPHPNANTCIKLASYLYIYDRLYGGYSGYDGPSETEFLRAVKKKDMGEVIGVIDTLMSTLMTVNPKLYDATMQRLR